MDASSVGAETKVRITYAEFMAKIPISMGSGQHVSPLLYIAALMQLMTLRYWDQAAVCQCY